jgi:hypothetical protein
MRIGAAVLLIGSLAAGAGLIACVGGGDVGVGVYDYGYAGDYYEPGVVDYGWWGPGYGVGPPRYRNWGHGCGGRAPSIPSRPHGSGGGHPGGGGHR